MAKFLEFQNAYSVSCRNGDLVCADPSLAQQQFKDDADINVMLERFKVTGQMPAGIVLPQYGDFVGITDYRSACDVLLKASDEFGKLPANLRSRFENNPQKFLEFCANPENLPELRKLGLAPEIPPEVVTSVKIVGGIPAGDPKPKA